MEICDLILADYAATGAGGKFTLVGAGITGIRTSKIPHIHPTVYLFVRFKVTLQDYGKNEVEILIVGEKGTVFKTAGEIQAAEGRKEEEYVNLTFQVQNIFFETAGDYYIEVRINGQARATQLLRVTLTDRTAAQ